MRPKEGNGQSMKRKYGNDLQLSKHNTIVNTGNKYWKSLIPYHNTRHLHTINVSVVTTEQIFN